MKTIWKSEGEWTPSVISQRNQQSSPRQPTQQRTVPRFESTSGRALGGEESNIGLSQRSNARDAMLEAAERRAQQQKREEKK